MTDRTEVKWSYTPADLFEAPFEGNAVGFAYSFDAGRVVANLDQPTHPLSREEQSRLTAAVRGILLARQALVHRAFTLSEPSITHYDASGRKHMVAVAFGASAMFMAGNVDAIVRDAAGNIVRDTRAERIAMQAAAVEAIATKAARSPLLRRLLEAYGAAVNDPSDELVHLYDVRELLVMHFGTEKATRNALGISKSEWQRLGQLANDAPLKEGRHKGKHLTGLRAATHAELSEVRQIAFRWIQQFSETL